jgi:2,4-dienoyl-CoA reductase-like NADH-dependent reductase (Old Yellow Enzyme family)
MVAGHLENGQLDPLFRPLEYKNLTLANRIVMAPMTRTCAGADGVPTAEMARYYARRAEHGTGLIITEGTYTDEEFSKGFFNEPGLTNPAHAEGWQRVTQAVHKAGGAIAAQLFHTGRRSAPEVLGGRTPRGPSAIAAPGKHSQTKRPFVVPQAMTDQEIAAAIAGFARSAELAMEAGFDAVEVHGAHGYLLDQFLWEGSNVRADEYGGSLERRLRFPVEVVRAIRARLGEERAIIYRFSLWRLDDANYTPRSDEAELRTIVTALAEAGVDIFHVSTQDALAPAFATERTLAALTRATLRPYGGPVIAVGKITQPETARRLLQESHSDLIALGKAILANPDWVEKVRLGREAELRPFDPVVLESLT